MHLDDELARLFKDGQVGVSQSVSAALRVLSDLYSVGVVKGYVQEWLRLGGEEYETLYPYDGMDEDIIGMPVDDSSASVSIAMGCVGPLDERPIPFHELKGLSEVSAGNFGSVHKGTYQASDIAVKVLHRTYNARHQSRFLMEIAILRRFRHQNIVTYYGYSTCPDNTLCLVMEYCHGGSLYHALQNRCKNEIRITVADVMRITTHVCSALHSLHCAGVVHRDIAVRNVFLQSPGGISDSQIYKVGDLGLSQSESSLSSISTTCTAETIASTEPACPYFDALLSLARCDPDLTHLNLFNDQVEYTYAWRCPASRRT
eukprot:TRINITY_DN14236_c0_g1_i2.p1 TRINITY_DN14236_c0_g1~~TRINITY_DN14236_c0_g1_i2.p1  ORF type:complete len:316 (+),score=79.58 TRINITY_DN14236_c0_g1_i2:785-1732(+)